MTDTDNITVDAFYENYHNIRHELSKAVVGQAKAIDHLLTTIFARGHALLKGFPGLGRTLIVKTMAEVMGLDYGRIQFTPDLLPTDITGTEVLENDREGKGRHFRFFKGPIFANLVLADEVNRSPARTQSALLEVMQEKQVSMGGQTYFLPKPFILIATQNTLDTEGVFALGEAQVDRFLTMVEQDFPSDKEEEQIIYCTTGTFTTDIKQVVNPETIIAMQNLAREVPVVPSIKEFALSIIRSSRKDEPGSDPEISRYVRLGASPRATQALILLGKVRALTKGRFHVNRQDIVDAATPVLAHRVLIDFRAKADGIDHIYVINRLIERALALSKPNVSLWTRELLNV